MRATNSLSPVGPSFSGGRAGTACRAPTEEEAGTKAKRVSNDDQI
jgi:hypothetical protein